MQCIYIWSMVGMYIDMHGIGRYDTECLFVWSIDDYLYIHNICMECIEYDVLICVWNVYRITVLFEVMY